MIPSLILLFLLNMTNPLVIYDFSATSELRDWTVVNDDVMGGQSQGTLSINPEGNGVFAGRVSLENSGGFSLVRYRMTPTNIAGLQKVVIRLKGDGKRYQFRLKSQLDDYFSYVGSFQTSGEWELVEIPLQELYPAFRGRRLDEPNFSGDTIVEIGLLIGNKKNESFLLELDKISVL